MTTLLPRPAGLAAALLLLGSLPAGAQNLTIGIGGSPTSLDPHFYNASPNISLTMHLFDRLVEQDAQARIQPALAESWRAISDTTWEFKLRPGVKWHDGRAFTADDVVFTISRAPNVPNSPGGFGGFVRAITRTEVVDPLTIRFHTAAPHPLLPTELASIQIISRHVGEGAATEDYNSGRAAIGTGPYRIVSYRPGDRTEFTRNPDYWRGQEPWARVSYRFIANDAARTAGILAGDLDVIDQVPSSDIARLRQNQRVTISEIQGLRLIYLMTDFSRTDGPPVHVSDNEGRPLPRNPMLDSRVRRALSIAIDREALSERVMEGTARPTGQWLPPGSYSYNPAVVAPRPDPDGARRMLAEAGFPQGFRLTLHTPNDRYPNDARTAQAVAQMWTRVGVRTQVESLPWAAYAARTARQEHNARLAGWGSVTGEASYMLVNIFGTFDREKRTGASNNSRYSNPELDALTARATATLDDAARERLLQEAVAMVDRETAMIPLFQLVNFWATRRGITYEPRMDERTVAMGARPAN
ncbi:ABC transporter substrate-binding protein [Falsiroseomonas ponticola]|uniref:ABC transporter substrate-binding protein n=1 Tax=Falsiroseomonas ponticola TaxID=2786951 RepID=UPI0019344E34|nr:ABC transporter substrate-binding protein [Roseomonas ponticola]